MLPDTPSVTAATFVACFPAGLAFDLDFWGLSSSEASSEDAADLREAVEREEEDFTDLTSVSESGTSWDSFERDFRTMRCHRIKLVSQEKVDLLLTSLRWGLLKGGKFLRK